MDQNIANYIKQMQDKGYSEESIKDKLRENGHDENTISSFFQAPQDISQSKLPILIISLVVLILIIVGISFFIFNNNNSSELSNSDDVDITNWKTYKNSKYGFEFKYPSSDIIKSGAKIISSSGEEDLGESTFILMSEDKIQLSFFIVSTEIFNIDSIISDSSCEMKKEIEIYNGLEIDYLSYTDCNVQNDMYSSVIDLKNGNMLFTLSSNPPNEVIFSTFKLMESEKALSPNDGVQIHDIDSVEDCEIISDTSQKQTCLKMFEEEFDGYVNCTDSDGGANYYEKGTVVANRKPGRGSGSVTDSCSTDFALVEYVCGSDNCAYSLSFSSKDMTTTPNYMKALDDKTCTEKTVKGGFTYLCSSEGKVCIDGACVDPERKEEVMKEQEEYILSLVNSGIPVIECELDNDGFDITDSCTNYSDYYKTDFCIKRDITTKKYQYSEDNKNLTRVAIYHDYCDDEGNAVSFDCKNEGYETCTSGCQDGKCVKN